MIPQLDLVVTLNDTGFTLPIVTELDTSITLGSFGLNFVSSGATGLELGSVPNVAKFPSYNSAFGAMLEPPVNFDLKSGGANVSISYTTVPPIGFSGQSSTFDSDSGQVLVLDITNIFATGVIGAKIQSFPGIVDYTQAGMIPLVIGNASVGISFYASKPVYLNDGTHAFCISVLSSGTGTLAPGNYILLVRSDLTTSGYLIDTLFNNFGVVSCSWLSNSINYQADLTVLPTVTVYTLVYDFALGQTVALNGTGTVSTDAANSFQGPFSTSPFLTSAVGLFGVDWNSGNDTGCWYCALDCSAFGRVKFSMPDGSIGPSSSANVWNNGNNAMYWSTYPNVDTLGNWWWIRLPLEDALGNIVLEPLTSRVYTSIVQLAAFTRIDPNTLPVYRLPFCMEFKCDASLHVTTGYPFSHKEK